MLCNRQKKLNIFILLMAVALVVFSCPVAATAQELNDVNFMDDPNLFAELRISGVGDVEVGIDNFGLMPSVRDFIDSNPKLAYSIKWEVNRINYPGSYDQKESAKLSWPDWTEEMKQDLEDAFEASRAWYNSPDPFNDLDETIEYPPTNINPGVDNDTGAPWMSVLTEYAWEFYIRWIAQNLLAEYEGHFPWSVLDYDTEQLKILFDSTAIFARSISASEYGMSTGAPGHGNYHRRAGNMGVALAAPPRYTYAFLNSFDLIGSDRLDTIVRVLTWGSDNLIHFYGASNYGNYEDHWQFRGPPPITRIIEGTIREGESSPEHLTAGCHGTTGFLRHVLRAANIPVQIVNRCGHSLGHFITEGLYMDHGDDIYNLTFKSLGVSPLELLIDETTQQHWFGDNPHNNEDYCSADGAIGRQVHVLEGSIEICDDGVDNDSDGDVDCEDSDCPTRELTRAIKLTASDAIDEARLGVGLDTSDGRVIVGAQGLSSEDEVHGSAYILAYKSGAGWVEEAKLKPSNLDHDSFFGTSVSLSGDVALADAEVADGYSGFVYAFERQSDGAWTEEAVLQSSDNQPGDRFGISTALEGSVSVIGAFGDDGDKGSAYVFTRTGSGTWSQTQKLMAGDGASGDLFGYDVDIAGDVIVVGAYKVGNRTGAAYVFRNTGWTWEQEAKLEADDAAEYASFGWSVATNDSRIIIGAFGHDDAANIGAGAAYVFEYDAVSGSWDQAAKLESPTPQQFGGFGYHVSLQGDRAVVGAYGEDEATGAAYVFDFDGSLWNLAETLKPEEGILGDRFGASVRMDGDSIYVGAYGDPSQGPFTGALYLYDRGSSPRGQCVNVAEAQTGNPDVTVTYSAVARAGTTDVTSSTTGPAPPVGFQLGDPPTYYDITTTTDYVGRVEVCIDYSEISFVGNEEDLKLYHFEDTDGDGVEDDWVDCTDSVDTVNKIICGTVTSFSRVAIFEPENQPPVANAGDDQTVEQESYEGTEVTLDGSGSTDLDSTPGTNDDIVSFDWFEGATLLGSSETINYTFPLGSHSITLEVTDSYGETDEDEAIIVVQDTTPPDITCPADVTVEQESYAGTVVALEATATDNCDPNPVITSNELAIYPLGVTTVTFTATDASGNSASCSMTVTVVDTTPPEITLNGDATMTLECGVDSYTEEGATATDICDPDVPVVIGGDTVDAASCGTYIISYDAADVSGNQAAQVVRTVIVEDTISPEFILSVEPAELKPHNHEMVLITPVWEASDNCDDEVEVSLLSITSNQADDGIGDGHTTEDILVTEEGLIYLRAEIGDSSEDRIYTLIFEAVDDSGNSNVQSAIVVVPVEQLWRHRERK